jgi:DNA replication protein DnaC
LQLVSSRYERASLIVTVNKVFGRWGEVFGDDIAAAAVIDRLVHDAEVIALEGDSYRLEDGDLGRVPPASIRAGTIRRLFQGDRGAWVE